MKNDAHFVSRANRAGKIFFPLLVSVFFILKFSGQTFSNPAPADTCKGAGTITTAVPFLLIAPDSRSGAIGETGVGLIDNSNAMHWNVGALAFINKKVGVSVSYVPWLRNLVPDINLSYVSGSYKLKAEQGTLGFSILYFALGKIIFTDDQGNVVGEANANEFAGDVGFSKKLSEHFSAGLAGRFIYSNLAPGATVNGVQVHAGKSFAADIACLYNKDFKIKIKKTDQTYPLNLRWGINISNIGSKIGYTVSGQKDFIPTNLRVGYALRLDADKYNSIALSMDFNKLMVPSAGGASNVPLIEGMIKSFYDAPCGFKEEFSEINVQAGLEYWYNKLFAVRAGYFYEDPNKGNRKFITLGLGIKYNILGIDFSYLVPFEQDHPLANTLRFTLSLDFEGLKNQK